MCIFKAKQSASDECIYIYTHIYIYMGVLCKPRPAQPSVSRLGLSISSWLSMFVIIFFIAALLAPDRDGQARTRPA